jgi:hypothetical protein
MPAPAVYFGSGNMYVKPVSGNLAANPTPSQIGTLQDCQVEISREIKELYGQSQFPVAIAPAKHKLTGKAKFAQIFGKQWSDMVYGQTTSAGYKSTFASPATAVPTTPFQLTPTVPASGTFVEDLGVIYSNTGIPLVKVASAPTIGQYTETDPAGVYLFAAADVASLVTMSFAYSVPTVGQSVTVSNQLMGFGPIIEVTLNVQYNNQAVLMRIFNAVCSKITLPTKNDDFVIPDFEFSAFANAAGAIYEMNNTQ